jgi:2'-deoxynucleoside 5'-phosphate N-hydrolase
MKIYFAGSIRGGRDDAHIYQSLIAYISSFGEVLTEHVGYASLSDKGDDGPDDRHIYERDMAWLTSSDVVIAEVSVPSLGVGYELGYAVALKKPVLCLHRLESGRRLSAMVAGSPHIQAVEYGSIEEAEGRIAAFLSGRLQPTAE